MEKIGYVIGKGDGKVVIDLKRTGSCGDKCASCKSACEVSSIQVEVDNTLDAHVGDFVEIGMQPKQLIRTTFIVYTIPLIMFVLGMALAVAGLQAVGVTNYEFYSILIGFATLAVTFLFIRVVLEKREQQKESILKLNKIL